MKPQRYRQAREQIHTRMLIIAVWALTNYLGYLMLAAKHPQ